MTMHSDVSTPSTGDEAIFNLKQFAALHGWSVANSGDGASAYSGTGDVIAAPSDLATAGAWFSLKMGGTSRMLQFIRKSASTNWTVKYAPAGFAGGSATAAASGASAQTLLDGPLLGADGAYRWLVACDDAAPYELIAAALTIGTLAATTGLALLAVESGSCDAAEQDPYVLYASATSVWAWTELYQAYTGFKNFRSWYRYTSGLGGSSWLPVGFAVPWIGTSNIGGQESFVALGARSSVSGQEVPLSILCGFRPSSGVSSVKGRVRGARYAASTTGTAPNGTHLTDGGGLSWVRVGDLWLQWNASVPTL